MEKPSLSRLGTVKILLENDLGQMFANREAFHLFTQNFPLFFCYPLTIYDFIKSIWRPK